MIAPLEKFTLDDFDRLLAVNVRAVFVASQEAARHMGEGGRIITIGSVNADRMPVAGGGPYAMTKAAVAGLTRGLARDLGPRGITVNNVQPGPVDTDMNPDAGPFAEMLKSHMALPRYGRADEIAAMVAYLAGLVLPPAAETRVVFRFTATAAVLGYALSHAVDSIWKGLSWKIAAKFALDGLAYGLVTGATFAWLWPAA